MHKLCIGKAVKKVESMLDGTKSSRLENKIYQSSFQEGGSLPNFATIEYLPPQWLTKES
jgi:hypothetical protein